MYLVKSRIAVLVLAVLFAPALASAGEYWTDHKLDLSHDITENSPYCSISVAGIYTLRRRATERQVKKAGKTYTELQNELGKKSPDTDKVEELEREYFRHLGMAQPMRVPAGIVVSGDIRVRYQNKTQVPVTIICWDSLREGEYLYTITEKVEFSRNDTGASVVFHEPGVPSGNATITGGGGTIDAPKPPPIADPYECGTTGWCGCGFRNPDGTYIPTMVWRTNRESCPAESGPNGRPTVICRESWDNCVVIR